MRTSYGDMKTWAIADLVAPGELTPGWCLTRISVPPQHRGHGHGSALLRRVLADADAEGVVLWLEVESSGPLDDDALREWYMRHGFRPARWGYLLRRPAAKEGDGT